MSHTTTGQNAERLIVFIGLLAARNVSKCACMHVCVCFMAPRIPRNNNSEPLSYCCRKSLFPDLDGCEIHENTASKKTIIDFKKLHS